jgi:hypothetical protein
MRAPRRAEQEFTVTAAPLFRITLAAGLSLVASSCPLLNMVAPDPAPLPTVPGPENESLLADVHGWVLQSAGGPVLEAIALPSLEHTQVELSTRPWFKTGPDELGRFVYAGEDSGTQIILGNVDRRKEVVLDQRPGSPLWNDTLDFIQLSRRGGWVALGVRAFDRTSEFQPKTEEHLEIWNLDDGSRSDFGPVPAWSVAWFPDDRRLLVERRVPPGEIGLHEAPPVQMEERNSAYKYPGCVTSLQILDVQTRTWVWVGWGEHPLLSPDGRHVLCYRGGGEDGWCVIDLHGNFERKLELPDCIGLPLAWLGDNIVLYPALATTGADPGVCRSPTKRPRANWTIKAGRIGGPDFLTVIPSVDRFTSVSCSVHAADPSSR